MAQPTTTTAAPSDAAQMAMFNVLVSGSAGKYSIVLTKEKLTASECLGAMPVSPTSPTSPASSSASDDDVFGLAEMAAAAEAAKKAANAKAASNPFAGQKPKAPMMVLKSFTVATKKASILGSKING